MVHDLAVPLALDFAKIAATPQEIADMLAKAITAPK